MRKQAAKRLIRSGFNEVRPGVFVRLQSDRDDVIGCAVYDRSGVTVTCHVRMPLETARSAVLKLGRDAAGVLGVSRKRKAERLLGALMTLQLGGEKVAGHEDEDDVDTVVGYFEVGRSRAERQARRKRRRGKRKGRRKELKQSVNRLSTKLAKNKVMTAMRSAYADVITGPLGDAAAGVAASVLQAYGVPPKVSRTAIKAHHARTGDRMRHGGWSGVVSRGSDADAKFGRTVLKEEGLRFIKGAKTGVEKEFGSLSKEELAKKLTGEVSKQLQAQQGGGMSSMLGDLQIGEVVAASETPGPFHGVGVNGLYNLGSCC